MYATCTSIIVRGGTFDAAKNEWSSYVSSPWAPHIRIYSIISDGFSKVFNVIGVKHEVNYEHEAKPM